METQSQSKQIRSYLSKGKSLTSLDALKLFGCLRLSGRILELRKDMNIKTTMIEVNGKRVAKYSIVK